MKDEAHAKPQLKVFDFVGCEIDNNWFDIALSRIENWPTVIVEWSICRVEHWNAQLCISDNNMKNFEYVRMLGMLESIETLYKEDIKGMDKSGSIYYKLMVSPLLSEHKIKHKKRIKTMKEAQKILDELYRTNSKNE